MPQVTNPWANRCERCGERMHIHTGSMFNGQIICLLCKRDERMSPGYAAAALAEAQAVRNGDLNFPGVGLGPKDMAFLAERLKRRPLPKE